MMPPIAFKLEMFELGEHLITGNPGGGARGGEGTSQDAGICPTTGELYGLESYNLSDTVGDRLASEVETAGESGYPASKEILAIDAAVWPNGLALLASSFVILFGVEEGVEKGLEFGMGIFFFFFLMGDFVGSLKSSLEVSWSRLGWKVRSWFILRPAML